MTVLRALATGTGVEPEPYKSGTGSMPAEGILLACGGGAREGAGTDRNIKKKV
jgi:hypothetical protein